MFYSWFFNLYIHVWFDQNKSFDPSSYNIKKLQHSKNSYTRISVLYAKTVSKIKYVSWNKFCQHVTLRKRIIFIKYQSKNQKLKVTSTPNSLI